MTVPTTTKAAVLALVICTWSCGPARCEKNMSGMSMKQFMSQRATGYDSRYGQTPAGNLTAPPKGWLPGNPLPLKAGVRHDLSLSNWVIKNQDTGTAVGLWEWNTSTQNFVGKYKNGAVDTLRFDQYNFASQGGHIALSGFNNQGVHVKFVGVQYEKTALGTATVDLPNGPLTWQWSATW